MSDGVPAYLAKYGPALVANGYQIVPIVRGSKAPGLDYPAKRWSSVVADAERVAKWAATNPTNGVGILAKNTPGVDIDCHDDTMTAHMREFVMERLGSTIERVGLAPKTLLLYRTEQPFPKVTSSDYIDNAGRKARLEVLGDGQQFVALAIHPDTKRPYRWLEKRGPNSVPVSDLPLITHADALAIRDEFDRLAGERAWQTKKSLKRLESGVVGRHDPNNVFAQDAHKVSDLNTEQLRARLQMVPGAEDYETWFQIGMALYHQFDGDEEGLILWDEWSSSAMNYDAEAIKAKWPSFEVEGKGRAPVTARLILKLAKEAEEVLITESLQDCLDKINEAETIKELIEACDPIKSMAFDKPTRGMLSGKVQARYKIITKTTLTISDARDMVRFENPENRNLPFWLDGFCYVQFDKRFFNMKTKLSLDTQAFDQSYGRYMMTKQDQLEGRAAPEFPASHVALHRYQIPTVAMGMYMPGEDIIFSINGKSYVNTYDESGLPEVPETISLAGRVAIEIVKNHMVHLFADAKDRELLLDWFAWIVQTQQRVSWCPLIQGTEGDGKSWFSVLMSAVLGMENTQLIPGDALKEKYTAWAEGNLIVFIEEVRLHGKDRYAAVNNMKPFVTNPRVPIRRMNTDSYNVINRTSYCAFTNFRDGIPAGASDTRYFPMFSRWQTYEAIQAFKLDNPDYYINLFGALDQAGALRKWFLQREISDTFKASARAPESRHRQEMIYLSQDDETEAFTEALKGSTRLDFSRELLDSALVAEELVGRGSVAPHGKRLKMMLSEFGFAPLGRIKIGGETRRWWTMHPEMFLSGPDKIDTTKVRGFLESGGL